VSSGYNKGSTKIFSSIIFLLTTQELLKEISDVPLKHGYLPRFFERNIGAFTIEFQVLIYFLGIFFI
jgi:hypothetical protein